MEVKSDNKATSLDPISVKAFSAVVKSEAPPPKTLPVHKYTSPLSASAPGFDHLFLPVIKLLSGKRAMAESKTKMAEIREWIVEHKLRTVGNNQNRLFYRSVGYICRVHPNV